MMRGTVVELREGFFLIKTDEKDLHRNIFLRRYRKKDGKTFSIIMDPGTPADFPLLSKVLKDLIGGIQKIDLIFLSHQDPDVSSNMRTILSAAPHSKVLASIDSWRLLRMYGVPEKRFVPVEKFGDSSLKIKGTDDKIRFLHARYCHFRGSIMLYDVSNRILFSGDVMAGVNTREGEGIWADESSWDGIAVFHEIYMPTSRALKITIDKISQLVPFPEIVAPQHGDIIRGELVVEFLTRLMDLKVGIDLEVEMSPEKEALLLAINDFLEKVKEIYKEDFLRILAKIDQTHDFTSIFDIKHDAVIEVKLAPDEASSYFWKIVEESVTRENLLSIKSLYLNAMVAFGAPIPEELQDDSMVDDVSVEEMFE